METSSVRLPLSVRLPSVTAAVVLGAALAVQAAMLVPWLFAPGTPMDEGSALTYGGLVWHGLVPMRDVRAFYGPLNSYVVGVLLHLTGGNLYAERLLGLAYRLAMVAAVLLLVRHRGTVAIVGATVVLVLIPPTYGLSGSARGGALATTSVAILLASRRRPLAAGAVAGIAVAMRYDWIVPIALASIPWLVAWSWRERLRSVGGFLAVVALVYVPYLATVGLGNALFSLRLLRTSQGARRLPLPSVTERTGVLLELVLAALVLLAVVGLRRRRTIEGRVFLSIALLGVGTLPYALDRPDRTHILAAGFVPVVVSVAALLAALDELRRHVRRPGLIGVAVGCAVVVVLASVATVFPPRSYAVSYGGRTFLLGNERDARDAESAVRLAGELAPAGGRLFVGPADLRRTDYDDAYMYYLLPRLRPATFFVELDPGVTVFSRHRLADELPRADVLILNRAYDLVSERNASADYGPSAPNRVVARDFCRRGHFGTFLVYARCHR
jgi:hypothetical protein